MAEFQAELTLPNAPDSARLARAFVRELAALAGFAPAEVEALAAGAVETCNRVLALAFAPGEAGTLVLRGAVTPVTLALALREQGLPFDPAHPPAALAPYLAQGLVDEAHWVSLGRDGMELQVCKARPQADVTAHLPADALAPFHAEAPLAPPQDYTIRRMQPAEAVQVAQCVYRAWGYSYINDDLYYPERIAHLNATGQLVSIVAVDAAGEVVGHLALERPTLGPIAESGVAVVAPAHRGRHLLERLRAFLEDEARRLGLIGVFGQPVTSHPYSQRAEEDFHAAVCGVSLGCAPRSLAFKQIRDEPLAQRESLLLYFKYLGPPPTAVVYAPAHHRAMLERLYEHLQVPAEFREAAAAGSTAPGADVDASTPPRADGEEVTVSMARGTGMGTIRVRHVGPDTAAAVRQARRDLCETAGAEVVYLELPLAQPGTPALCAAAESDGFFFSGLGPCFAPDGDVLRLQYLQTSLDPARLQIASPFAQTLLAYVVQERARIGQAT